MFLVQNTVLLCLIFPIAALAPPPPPRTALAPRVRDQRRQGSSLSDVLDPALAKPLDDDTWDVYFDEETGYPYYHNVETDQVQWEHPFADAPSTTVPECESPWLIYEFQFDGIFDHLTPIKYRSRIPRGGTCAESSFSRWLIYGQTQVHPVWLCSQKWRAQIMIQLMSDSKK